MFTRDYHIHTSISPCASDDLEMQKILDIMAERGMESVGFADHCYGFKYRVSEIEKAKQALSECDTALNVYLGVEAHILQYRAASINVQLASYFDYVIMAPNHYHIRGVAVPDAKKPAQVAIHELYMFEAAINCPYTDAVAHPFFFSPEVFKMSAQEMASFSHEVMQHIDDKRLTYALEMAAYRGIGIELSPRFIGEEQKHLIEFYHRCLECGVKLFIGSDAHSYDDLDKLSLLEPIAKELGIREEHLWRPYEWNL